MGAAKGQGAKASEMGPRLDDVKKDRCNLDNELQAMLNRITFLRCEEAKLDKNIEKAKLRVQECLSHKAARTQLHDDIALAVQDVLGTLQSQQESRGRSTIKATVPRPTVSTADPGKAKLPRAQPVAKLSDAAKDQQSSTDHATAKGLVLKTRTSLTGDLSPMGTRKVSRQLSGRRSTPVPTSSAFTAAASPIESAPAQLAHPTLVSTADTAAAHAGPCEVEAPAQSVSTSSAQGQQDAAEPQGTTPSSSHTHTQLEMPAAPQHAPQASEHATSSNPKAEALSTTAGQPRTPQQRQDTPADDSLGVVPRSVTDASQPAMQILHPGISGTPTQHTDTALQPSQPPRHNRMTVLRAEHRATAECSHIEDPFSDTHQAATSGRMETCDSVGTTRKVISLKSTAPAQPVSLGSTVVVAAGVGWGLGPRPLGEATPVTLHTAPLGASVKEPVTQQTVAGRPPSAAGSLGAGLATSKAAGAPMPSSAAASGAVTTTPGGHVRRSVSMSSSHASSVTGASSVGHKSVSGSVSGVSAASTNRRLAGSAPVKRGTAAAAAARAPPGTQQTVKGGGGGAGEDVKVKQQIWRVRRAFGLEPAQLKDQSAKVDVVGAGVWATAAQDKAE